MINSEGIREFFFDDEEENALLEQDGLSLGDIQRPQALLEMATINNKDSSQSPLYPGAYHVDIRSDEGNKIPHVHVCSKSEGFDIRIRIDNGELLSVKKYGQRKRTDMFTDIVKLSKKWFPLQSTSDKLRKNRDFAYLMYAVMNPDSPYNKEEDERIN